MRLDIDTESNGVVTGDAMRRRGRAWGTGGGPVPHPSGVLGTNTPSTDHGLDIRATDPLLLDSREVARLLGLGRTKVFQMMARSELPVVRLGRCVRVPRAALIAWIAAQTQAVDLFFSPPQA